MTNLVVLLTIRTESERFPGKALADVAGKPLVLWILERLSRLNAELVVATTADGSDDELARTVDDAGVPVYRWAGDVDDVVGRMDACVREWWPDARYVFRALGDCPFIEPEIVARSVWAMDNSQRPVDHFCWYLNPESAWPVYGAREFPYARKGWDKVATSAKGEEREHVDMYFNKHRDRFRVLYHEPPPFDRYFNPRLRLEVDWPEDLELVRRVAEDGPGMLAPLPEVVRWLEDHQEVVELNQHLSEKTGLFVSFDRETRRRWQREMDNQPVVAWDDSVYWPRNSKGSRQVFCAGGTCLVGHAERGVLYTLEGHVVREGRVSCECGTGRNWARKRR